MFATFQSWSSGNTSFEEGVTLSLSLSVWSIGQHPSFQRPLKESISAKSAIEQTALIKCTHLRGNRIDWVALHYGSDNDYLHQSFPVEFFSHDHNHIPPHVGECSADVGVYRLPVTPSLKVRHFCWEVPLLSHYSARLLMGISISYNFPFERYTHCSSRLGGVTLFANEFNQCWSKTARRQRKITQGHITSIEILYRFVLSAADTDTLKINLGVWVEDRRS